MIVRSANDLSRRRGWRQQNGQRSEKESKDKQTQALSQTEEGEQGRKKGRQGCKVGQSTGRRLLVIDATMVLNATRTFASLVLLLTLVCCNQTQPVEQKPSNEGTGSAIPMEGFSWIVEGELAAMPLPGRNRPLAEDAAFLQREGVQTLVSLTEKPPDSAPLEEASIRQVHIPIPDYTAPTLGQMIEFVDLVSGSAEQGEPVGVHCTAGLGRSGTMAAAYLVAKGSSAKDAMATIRRLRPGSIETDAQENAVRQAEAHFSRRR